jgi:oligoribonuclease
MLAWIDLETTGLSPRVDRVLEVACVVTDDQLHEVARFERVAHHEDASALARLFDGREPTQSEVDGAGATAGVDPYVVRMHAQNGLWSLCETSPHSVASIDAELTTFLRYQTPELMQLAGSTISFDRAFLAEHMKQTLAAIHYRNVDVTSFNEVARRFWPTVHDSRPRTGRAHRAMSDILESIAVLRHYVADLMPAAHAVDGL